MTKPVVIDLSPTGAIETQDGLQFFTLWNSPVFINSDEDGYRERTAWVGPDEGIVVHDVGNDDRISSYKEVALSASDEAIAKGAVSDMDALLKLYDTGYDKNGNHTIDADEGKGDKIISAGEADANFLKIWRDTDLDGVVDLGVNGLPGEMVSFVDAGIAEIDLTDFNSPELDHDNDGTKDPDIIARFSDGSTIYNTAKVKMTNGSTTTAYDMGFAHERAGISERKSGDIVLEVKLERNIGVAASEWLYKTANVDGSAVVWNFDQSAFDSNFGGVGTNGNDTMSFSGSQSRSFSGGAGNDTLTGGEGDDFLVGGTGVDKLTGGAGNDVLYIDAEDTGTGGKIDGGDGYDVLRVNSADGVTVDLKLSNAEAFFGGAGDDTVRVSGGLDGVVIVGAKGNDSLYGGSGDDTVSGGDGADKLVGGNGDDVLIGGDGVDKLYGSAGDDLIYADEFDDFTAIEGGDGFDVLVIDDSINRNQVFATALELAALGFEAAVGGDGNDNFVVTTEEDTFLYGAGGDDVLRTGAGDDLIAGGDGDDMLDGNGGSDLYLFNRGDGDDKISEGIVVETDGNGGRDTISFGLDIDVDDLQFDSGSNLLISLRTENKATLSGETLNVYGWSSNRNQVETLAFSDGTILDIAGASFTTLSNGNNSNATSTEGSSAPDNVGASNGLDVIDAGEGDDVIYAWSGNDIVLGRLGYDEIHGGVGHDYLDGGFYADTLYGDAGDDTLIGGKDSDATDTLYGGSGNDILDAGGGNDQLYGESGEDILSGGDGNNMLDGGTGDDKLFGGKGTDMLKGGTGDDIYFYSRGDGADTIIDTGSDDDDGGIRYTSNPSGPDKVGDWLVFGAGITMDDLTFDAVGGNIIIGIGENGDLSKRPIELDDHITLTGMDGENRLERFLFSDGFSLDVVDDMSGVDFGTNGTDDLDDGDGDHFMSGGAGNDELSGGDGTDVLIGGAGNDSLSGGDSEDYLFGGSGDDIMNGGDGSDRLFGGAGNDTIAGGGGSDNDENRVDYLVGGVGDDTLIGGYSTDIYAFDYGEGTDTITDQGGVDTIELAGGIWFSDIEIAWDATKEKLRLDLNPLYRPDVAGTSVYFEREAIDQIGFANGFFLHSKNITDGRNGTQNDDVFDLSTATGGLWVSGKEGADEIVTGSGRDYLYGGRHNDLLRGNQGNDTYIINAGDGEDRISDSQGTDDSIAFGPGITLSDLILVREDGNMYIAVRDTLSPDSDPRAADSFITVVDLAEETHRIDWFEFADGTALKTTEIAVARIYGAGDDTATTASAAEWIDAGTGDDVINSVDGADIVFGRDGDDNIHAGDGDDTVYGEKDDDRLYGEDGNDTLIGGDGNDYIRGGAGHNRVVGGDGNDTLIGGGGSSLISGGKGDDIIYRGGYAEGTSSTEREFVGTVNGSDQYRDVTTWDDSSLEGGYRVTEDHSAVTVVEFALGDGTDRVIINSNDNLGPGDKDQIDLVGISSKQVWFQHVGDDLVLKILGTEDQLTFEDFFLGAAYRFDRINANGEHLTSDRIDALIDVMEDYSDLNDGTDGTGMTASELPGAVYAQIDAQWAW
ncbi:hypothetical protein ASG42_26855 [Rhizobium sp. Leaf391]|uniref:calcium-binding protein n=1 Tax=Rhizobium sp. Leaf391 TaxID=1736360 RepID=UPI000715BF36|nr:hypothetical protein [Rhizobium sp. Leaf391]KQT01632.1 hypothetical protein ASG42_26855 [Rhizobium sp. Leaf391]